MRSRSWFLDSRPASTVFSFACRWHSLLVSILLPPSVRPDTHAKKPGNHGCRVSHRFCARLGEQACSRDHDPRDDEYGHAGQQQYLVENSRHRTLPLLRSTTTSRRRWFQRPAGVQHSPSLFERWRAGARFMLLRLSGRRRTSLCLLLLSQLQPYIPLGQLCER